MGAGREDPERFFPSSQVPRSPVQTILRPKRVREEESRRQWRRRSSTRTCQKNFNSRTTSHASSPRRTSSFPTSVPPSLASPSSGSSPVTPLLLSFVFGSFYFWFWSPRSEGACMCLRKYPKDRWKNLILFVIWLSVCLSWIFRFCLQISLDSDIWQWFSICLFPLIVI